MDSISCKECKKCLFINTLQLIIQSSTKDKLCQEENQTNDTRQNLRSWSWKP